MKLYLYILDMEEYNPFNFYNSDSENLYSYNVIKASSLVSILFFNLVINLAAFLTEEEREYIKPQYFDDINNLEDYILLSPIKFKKIMIKVLKYLKKNDLKAYNKFKEDIVNLIKLANKAIKLNKPLGWEWI